MPSLSFMGSVYLKRISLLIAFILILTSTTLIGCNKSIKYTKTYIEYFDTVSSVVGYESNEETFIKNTEKIEALLEQYHKLFDIYNSYTGINNIYTINQNAGIKPITVDKKIIEFIDYAKDIYNMTNGKTDITFGSVLKIWHNYRVDGIANPDIAKLPEPSKLAAGAIHRGFDNIIIDREKNTVYISDKDMSLDVGAVAKGYATEQIAQYLEENGIKGYALNIGGNLRVVGDKPDGSMWTAGITNPISNDENSILMRVMLKRNSFVTSGSYLRFYTVDNIRYHHIIDTETLYPKNEFLSVSVSCDDSGLADSLSTALFNMDIDSGMSLINSLENTEALWVTASGQIIYSKSFENMIIRE